MDLEKIRKEIDGIDAKIVPLFSRRMQLSADIAAYKAKNKMAVLDTKREREIVQAAVKMAEGDMQSYTRLLYNTILSLSRAYQNSLVGYRSHTAEEIAKAVEKTERIFPESATVACQGVEGAYSQLACDKLFPKGADILYFRQFEAVFSAVEKGLCRYGILPIENSSYGSINAVYDLMKNYQFHIVKSIRLRINHSLLVKPGTKMPDIKHIVSHDQAISQCSEYLKRFENVKITVCENTAIAAQMVAEAQTNDIAAISSPNCAALYALQQLDSAIQNSDNNYTRFICISKDMEVYPGADRVSFMLTVPHSFGSLYSVISKFYARGINLTKLESRPLPGTDFQFMFYFDIEASVYAQNVLELITELENELDLFVVLGCYSEI